MVDPVDAVKMSDDGICGLMQMPADVLVETLFEFHRLCVLPSLEHTLLHRLWPFLFLLPLGFDFAVIFIAKPALSMVNTQVEAHMPA